MGGCGFSRLSELRFLLREMAIDCEVCHLNEGHVAFAVLERARDFMVSSGQSFAVALRCTRAGNVFTTHTPVEAGFDRFTAELMAGYFREYVVGTFAAVGLHRRNVV